MTIVEANFVYKPFLNEVTFKGTNRLATEVSFTQYSQEGETLNVTLLKSGDKLSLTY